MAVLIEGTKQFGCCVHREEGTTLVSFGWVCIVFTSYSILTELSKLEECCGDGEDEGSSEQ